MRWPLQVLFAVPFALAFAVALIWANTEAYRAVATAFAFAAGAGAIGFVLRKRWWGLLAAFAFLGLALEWATINVPFGPRFAENRPLWPALLAWVLGSGLLWAPRLLKHREAVLLVPIAFSLAATAAAATSIFYTRPPPPRPMAIGEAWLQWAPGSPRPSGPVDLQISYFFEGCSQPLDVQFGAEGASFSQTPPESYGFGIVNFFIEDIQGEAALQKAGELVPIQPPKIASTGGPRTFSAVRLWPRGLGSCYLQLPDLPGPYNQDDLSSSSFSPQTLIVRSAKNDVMAYTGSMSIANGSNPTMSQPGELSWTCRSSESDCFPLLVFTESWHDTFVNLMLLITGALMAGAVAACGRAVATLPLFADEKNPKPTS